MHGCFESRRKKRSKCRRVVGHLDFLSLIERGINAPSFETIEHIAKRLRVPVIALFDFERDRSRVQRKK